MGSLSVKNASEKFSRLGTFNVGKPVTAVGPTTSGNFSFSSSRNVITVKS